MAGKPFFLRPIPLGTVTAGNARAEAPATHLGEFFYRGMVWRTNGDGSIWARGDMGAATLVNFVSMMGANAQPGTTIRVRLGDTQAQVDATAAYDSGVLPFISAPALDFVFTPGAVAADADVGLTAGTIDRRETRAYHSHLEIPAIQARRWWRIDIGGHVGDFEASMLVMGQKLEPSRYYETTWQVGQRDLGSISFSRNGVPGVTRGARLRSMDYTLGWITEDEMEELFQPFDEAMGKTLPFFTCFDPEPTAKRQRRTFFGWNEEAPSLGKVGFNRFERKFSVLSLF